MVQSKQSHKPETSTTQTISRIVAASFDAFNNQANASFNAAGGVGLLGVGPGGINFGGIGTHDVNACKIIVDWIDTSVMEWWEMNGLPSMSLSTTILNSNGIAPDNICGGISHHIHFVPTLLYENAWDVSSFHVSAHEHSHFIIISAL
jgi:hypothetical protein